jgi:hypothetical protein
MFGVSDLMGLVSCTVTLLLTSDTNVHVMTYGGPYTFETEFGMLRYKSFGLDLCLTLRSLVSRLKETAHALENTNSETKFGKPRVKEFRP